MSRYSLLVLAVVLAVAASVPWRIPPGWNRNRQSSAESEHSSFSGAVCSITQNGSTRQFPCFPSNLLTCQDAEELPDFSSSAGITALSVCVPSSCEIGGHRFCAYYDSTSTCSDSPQVSDDDLEKVRQLCPNFREDDQNEFSTRRPTLPDTPAPSTPRPTTLAPTTETSTRSTATRPTRFTPPSRSQPTRFTRRTTLSPTTPTLPPLERLVMLDDSKRCTLSIEIKLAQMACRIRTNRGDIVRDCPPRLDGTIPRCSSNPDCQITINSEVVTLYLCPKPEPGPEGRDGDNSDESDENQDQNPGQDNPRPPVNRGQGNRGNPRPPVNRGQGNPRPPVNRGQGNPRPPVNRGQGNQGNRRPPVNQGQGQDNQGNQGDENPGQGNPRPPVNRGRGNQDQGNSRGPQGRSQGRGNSRNPPNRGNQRNGRGR